MLVKENLLSYEVFQCYVPKKLEHNSRILKRNTQQIPKNYQKFEIKLSKLTKKKNPRRTQPHIISRIRTYVFTSQKRPEIIPSSSSVVVHSLLQLQQRCVCLQPWLFYCAASRFQVGLHIIFHEIGILTIIEGGLFRD